MPAFGRLRLLLRLLISIEHSRTCRYLPNHHVMRLLFYFLITVNCVEILHGPSLVDLLVIRKLAVVVGLVAKILDLWVDALLLQFFYLGLVLFDLLLYAVEFTFAHHLVLRRRLWRNVARKVMSHATCSTRSHLFPSVQCYWTVM